MPNVVLLASEYEGDENITPAHDCYDIIDYQKFGFLTPEGEDINSLSPLTGSRRSALKENESCVMRVKIKSNLSHPNCFDEINYNEIATQVMGDDYGILHYEKLSDVPYLPFSTSIDADVVTDDILKFLPPQFKNFFRTSPVLIYLDGDNDFPVSDENELLFDNKIYGEEKFYPLPQWGGMFSSQ